MKIYIRNQIDYKSRFIVLRKLKGKGLNYRISDSGIMESDKEPSLQEICVLYDIFSKKGLQFAFVSNDLARNIRLAVNNIISKNLLLRTSISFYISDLFSIDYSYLNEFFRKETGKTIDQYYNEQKERYRYLARLSILDVPSRIWSTSWWSLN
jgi:hypothetical protein